MCHICTNMTPWYDRYSTPRCCQLSKAINISLTHHLIRWSGLTKRFISCHAQICNWSFEVKALKSSAVIHLYIVIVMNNITCVSRVFIIESASILPWAHTSIFLAQWQPVSLKTVQLVCMWGKKENKLNKSIENKLLSVFFVDIVAADEFHSAWLMTCVVSVKSISNKNMLYKIWILNNNRKKEERISRKNNLTAFKTCFCSTARITVGLLNC